MRLEIIHFVGMGSYVNELILYNFTGDNFIGLRISASLLKFSFPSEKSSMGRGWEEKFVWECEPCASSYVSIIFAEAKVSSDSFSVTFREFLSSRARAEVLRFIHDFEE